MYKTLLPKIGLKIGDTRFLNLVVKGVFWPSALRLYTNIAHKEGVTTVCLVQLWSLSLSLYVTQRRRERVLPHILYHHATEVKIFARENFSQQITVKTLKNSLSVVVKTLTLCSYNFCKVPGSNPAQ